MAISGGRDYRGEKAEQWQQALGLLADLPMSPDAARLGSARCRVVMDGSHGGLNGTMYMKYPLVMTNMQ